MLHSFEFDFVEIIKNPPSSARLTRKCRLLNRKTPYCTVSYFGHKTSNSLFILSNSEFTNPEQENDPLTEKFHIALCRFWVAKCLRPLSKTPVYQMYSLHYKLLYSRLYKILLNIPLQNNNLYVKRFAKIFSKSFSLKNI